MANAKGKSRQKPIAENASRGKPNRANCKSLQKKIKLRLSF